MAKHPGEDDSSRFRKKVQRRLELLRSYSEKLTKNKLK